MADQSTTPVSSPPQLESNIRRSSLARKPTKLYRLKRGTHSVPNPNADPLFAGDPEAMHFRAVKGDIIPLNDDQYKAFKDKFEPIEGEASDVAAADAKELSDAKLLAASTGQTVNPNIPLAGQTTTRQ